PERYSAAMDERTGVDLFPDVVNNNREGSPPLRIGGLELPMTVKEAARYLGVSQQTVYLWVERKQIPHLRVMGRNIRFLKSDLEPFHAQFKQEVENGTAK